MYPLSLPLTTTSRLSCFDRIMEAIVPASFNLNGTSIAADEDNPPLTSQSKFSKTPPLRSLDYWVAHVPTVGCSNGHPLASHGKFVRERSGFLSLFRGAAK